MLPPELVILLEEHIDLGLVSTNDPEYAICDVMVLFSYYKRSCSNCPFNINKHCVAQKAENLHYRDFIDYLQEHHPELYI